MSAAAPLPTSSNAHLSILRFSTAGSVDDGKSTLIGRLLHDSGNVYEDHLAALEVDKTTDMVVMDKSFVTKLAKLVEQMQSDFNKIVQTAQHLK